MTNEGQHSWMRWINFIDIGWGRTTQIILRGFWTPPFSEKSLKQHSICHSEKEDYSFHNGMTAKFCVNVFIAKSFSEIYSAMKMLCLLHALSLVVFKLKNTKNICLAALHVIFFYKATTMIRSSRVVWTQWCHNITMLRGLIVCEIILCLGKWGL